MFPLSLIILPVALKLAAQQACEPVDDTAMQMAEVQTATGEEYLQGCQQAAGLACMRQSQPSTPNPRR